MTQTLPDLMDASLSFGQMAQWYRDLMSDKLYGKMFELLVNPTGADGMPEDLSSQATEHLKMAVALYAPKLFAGIEGKLDNASLKTLRYAAKTPLARHAAKLMLFCECVSQLPETTKARLVSEKLTFYQAENAHRWAGMLVEARTGTILSPLDGSEYFTIYIPDAAPEKLPPPRSNFKMTVISRKLQ